MGFALCMLVLLVWRYQALSAGFYPLWADEAQYWDWSHNLAWGYFSKPPVVAWFTGLGTYIANEDSLFGIRFLAPLTHAVIASLLFMVGKELYDLRTAFCTGILYLLLPSVTLNSYFISADTPLLLFWMLALFGLLKADGPDNSNYWWIFTGVMVGLGLLSKYTMGGFAIGVALFTVWDKRIHWWYDKRFWKMAAVAAVVFAPNMLWNAQHDFISFRHTEDNTFSNGFSFFPLEALEFIGGQVGVLGPLLLVSFVVMLWKLCTQMDILHYRFLACFTLPLLVMAVAISVVSGAQAHWAAPAYLTGLLWLVHYLLHSVRTWLRLVVILGTLVLHTVAIVVFYHPALVLNHLHLKQLPYARVLMWHGIADHVTPLLRQYPEAVLTVDERKALVALKYDLRAENGTPYPVWKWNTEGVIRDHYDMIAHVDAYKGADLVFVTRTKTAEELQPFAEKVVKVEEFSVYGTRFIVYLLHGYKGVKP